MGLFKNIFSRPIKNAGHILKDATPIITNAVMGAATGGPAGAIAGAVAGTAQTLNNVHTRSKNNRDIRNFEQQRDAQIAQANEIAKENRAEELLKLKRKVNLTGTSGGTSILGNTGTGLLG